MTKVLRDNSSLRETLGGSKQWSTYYTIHVSPFLGILTSYKEQAHTELKQKHSLTAVVLVIKKDAAGSLTGELRIQYPLNRH